MSICRGCLVKEADVYQSLFSRIEMIPVQDMFEALTGLTVSREDGLPRYICQDCGKELLNFYRLREKMIESNAYLRSSIEPAVATCDEYGELGKTQGVSSKGDAPAMEVKSEYDQSSGDEINCDDTIVPQTKKRKTITAMQIERMPKGEAASVLIGSNQVEFVDEALETYEVVDYEDDDRSEYLMEDMDAADESDLAGNEIVVEEAGLGSPWLFCCGCPNVRFNSREELAKHTKEVHAKNRIFHNVRPYECNICYRRYLQYKWLKRHQAMPYRERNYSCNEPGCDARFFGRSALLGHKQSKHSGLRAYECELCKKSFFTSATLSSHRKMHSNKQYQCPTCRKMFLRQSDLLLHQATHLDERPFSCEQCDKRFKSRNHLRCHQLVHSSEPRLKCDLCDATFTVYNDRKVHLLRHKNIDPYKCGYCDKAYTRNNKLQGHIRKVHTGERPYWCTQCPQKFHDKCEQMAHWQQEHGGADTEHLAFSQKNNTDEGAIKHP